MLKKLLGSKNSGQALLTFILIMAIGLTIGLSLASRGFQDIKISTEIEESSRAFSAAEAGIEQSLQTGVAVPQTDIVPINASYQVEVDSIPAPGTDIYKIPGIINSNDTITIWLSDHLDEYSLDETSSYSFDNPIALCWDKESDTADLPAIELSIFYKEGSDYKIVRGAFDPDAVGRANNFDAASPGGGGSCDGFAYQKEIVFSDFGIPNGVTLLTLRIRPVYAPAKIAIDPPDGINLPIQGKRRVATGQTETGVTVKIIVFESYPSVPDIFDYALFSGGSLVK